MIIKLNAGNLAFAFLKLINQKRLLIFIIKKVLIMALNDTFNILPIKILELEADLISNFSFKDYWEEECKKHTPKK